MATVTNGRKRTVPKAMSLAPDAVRQWLDESGALGDTYTRTWGALTQASLNGAFAVQEATVQASRTMLDSAAQANSAWLERSAESVHQSQDAAARLAMASFGLVELVLPGRRD